MALPLLFTAGVLTSLTPCIYPMIPITAAIVGGHSATEAEPARWRPLLLSLTYAFGLAIVYSALGLFAGLTGTLFGTISTNPWLYFAMANVLVIAGLAMLDVIPVAMPAALVQRASTAGTAGAIHRRARDGRDVGTRRGAVLGAGHGGGAAHGQTTKSAWLGFAYLFAFSLGMCALLVAVGVSSGAVSRLPRAGMWMVRVKSVFAFVMLGVAEYYLIKMGQLLIWEYRLYQLSVVGGAVRYDRGSNGAIALTPALSVLGSLFPVPSLQAQGPGLAVGTKAPSSTIVTTLNGNRSTSGSTLARHPY